MPDDERLTPQQARARFGELIDRQSGAHREFDATGGAVWRPAFGPGG